MLLDDGTHLIHLIRLGLSIGSRLYIYYFNNTSLAKYPVASFCPLLEPQTAQKQTKVVEPDIRI